MTPAARIQAAIEIVDRWQVGTEELDRVVADWGRGNRYAGSGDRRAIGDLVYDAVRRLRSAAWVAGVPGDAGDGATGRAILLGSLLLDGLDRAAIGALFSGERYAPPSLEDAEAARLGQPLDAAPRAVRLDYPDWLDPQLEHVPDAALALLRERAPLFLRVNRLRTDRDGAAAALAEEGIATEPGALSPTCLRVLAGGRHVTRSRAFAEGLVEVQDAASQAAADYARAAPGEAVLDFCAGAGGKTLALAAAMAGRGRLLAHDVAPERLERLNERARRAGVEVAVHGPGETAVLAGRCDLVFVDAPCSGSGTWRRHPGTKWRLTPAGLAAHLETQDAILTQAAAAVAPGGRLIYATCSMLQAENDNRMHAFLRARPDFAAGRPPLRLTPLDGGDGFFACELVRAPR